MALYVKFQNHYGIDLDYIRFKNAIRFFDAVNKVLKFDKLKCYLFLGDPSDNSYPIKEFNFGILESYFRPEIKKADQKASYLGFAIQGIIKLEDKRFDFSYELRPRSLCGKERFDIRLEILPNVHAEIFEDLIKFKPNFKKILFERIKEYDKLKDKQGQFIKRCILSKFTEEYEGINKWDFLYTSDELYFLSKVIDSSEELSNRLSFGNRPKFSNRIIGDDNFAFLLSKYSKEHNVALAGNSIAIMPKNEEAMNKFIYLLAKDLNSVASMIYRKEEETEKLIQNALSKLV